MGKCIVTGIISAVVGFCVGTGTSYLYLKNLKDEKYEKEYAKYKKELEESRDKMSDLQKKLSKFGEEAKEGITPGEENLDSSNKYEDNLKEIEEYDNDDIYAELVEEQKDEDIRFISPTDYEDDDSYEKETIKYYAKDNILTQDDEIVEADEFEAICGKLALGSFGLYGAPSNEIYIRNEHFNTDYKIKRYNISYERYLNGLR